MELEKNRLIIEYESKIKEETEDVINLLFKKLIPIIQKKKKLKILFMGAGTGRVELPLLNKLLKINENIKVDYLDPCKEFFNES